MPPTERKGRVHTSTVTVAVVDPSVKVDSSLLARSDADFRVEWFSGTGAGGQHRNKTQNSCRLTHLPTGLKKESQTRSRQNSYDTARRELMVLLDEKINSLRSDLVSSDRKSQVGSGMRGDKVRTYRFRDDWVEDHRTGKGARCSEVMRGGFDLLWIK